MYQLKNKNNTISQNFNNILYRRYDLLYITKYLLNNIRQVAAILNQYG